MILSHVDYTLLHSYLILQGIRTQSPWDLPQSTSTDIGPIRFGIAGVTGQLFCHESSISWSSPRPTNSNCNSERMLITDDNDWIVNNATIARNALDHLIGKKIKSNM